MHFEQGGVGKFNLNQEVWLTPLLRVMRSSKSADWLLQKRKQTKINTLLVMNEQENCENHVMMMNLGEIKQ